jgi:hypothetical protein
MLNQSPRQIEFERRLKKDLTIGFTLLGALIMAIITALILIFIR